MKFEILARRIAEKSGLPELEEALLKKDLSLVPEEPHAPWTGRHRKGGVKPLKVRDHNMRPYIQPVMVSPQPLIQWEGKTHMVHRLVYSQFHELDDRVRMQRLCEVDLCINPHHFLAADPGQSFKDDSEDQPEMDLDDDWPDQEVEEMLDLYLMSNERIDPNHALLLDIPRPQLLRVVKDMGKDHLL